MELKLKFDDCANIKYFRSNCTFMELKSPEGFAGGVAMVECSNCTFMELK